MPFKHANLGHCHLVNRLQTTLLEYGKIFAVNIPSVAAVTCGIYFKF